MIGRTRNGLLMAAMAGMLVTTAGCYEHTIAVGGGAPTAPVVNEQQWQNFWLGGLVGHVRVDVEKMCPSGQATIETKQTFLNGLVTGLTSGIYAPLTLKVRCHDRARADMEVELSAQDMESIANDEDFTLWVAREFPTELARVTEAKAALAQQP